MQSVANNTGGNNQLRLKGAMANPAQGKTHICKI
jgi:hypothetical protein